MKYEAPEMDVVAVSANAAVATGDNGFVDQDGMELFSKLPEA